MIHMVNWSPLALIVCISNMDDAMHPQLLEQVIEGMARNAWDVGLRSKLSMKI